MNVEHITVANHQRDGLVVRVPGIEAKPDAEMVSVPTEAFLARVLNAQPNLHHLSRSGIVISKHEYDRIMAQRARFEEYLAQHPEYRRRASVEETSPLVRGQSLLLQTVHRCYAEHLPLSLAPEVIWHAIANEVAVTVKLNPETYAHLFTTTPEAKQKIVIDIPDYVYGRPNPWGRDIQRFEAELQKRVPSEVIRDMMPDLSTLTPEGDVAMLLTFMDAASPFYEYGMRTMCGIPSVRLEGTPEDWTNIWESAERLAESIPDLKLYFTHLLPVLSELERTAQGNAPDTTFWQSIYKQSGGSGGPYISGWITTLWNYYENPRATLGVAPKPPSHYDWKKLGGMGGPTTDNFTAHVSQVDFEWEYHGKKIPMQFVGGILGVEAEGEFLAPRTGFGVIEKST